MNTKYQNIIVSGDVGTGTSTLAKGLAEKLGWQFFSAGDFFRAYHKNHNIPLWDKSSIPDEVDKKIDQEIFEKLQTKKEIVVDSHYSAWFARNLPSNFRILLVCDKEVATKRILARQHTHKETPREIEERRHQLRAKFKKLYSNDNYENPKFFNLVLDTGKNNIPQTIELALEGLNKNRASTE
ncbi:MAG: hypothetical protein A2172_00580 [Candidatus Woykebacteria bacterium RBG_13_40_15]|uniref:(d)CMP kinase n=1 Tax=Candidatus Woykebacteria bacterium RBG_13_40_15 TaxID=1802593 RepID=A0A1G1W9L0_9BACT|nr:MAG: hypothetical protein A2172_00580 [Candidatus Woykebacteria bacterium RBG_13_40_15]